MGVASRPSFLTRKTGASDEARRPGRFRKLVGRLTTDDIRDLAEAIRIEADARSYEPFRDGERRHERGGLS
jgi:hypothetical protein